ncbi:cell envelope integrity protein TolA [Jatrophihabitans endophyticus]|uniref:cell envelope integrity protein TolA n=1 Tax=Jatrophihabitans endophyticus TaxID=1206085 RepID=UPI001A001971|nr:cell envelope integrity protein TolA [Jatrophihabitans endophyticus]MBE7187048.1 cell envelope integrity protein TolA [Jatrophihabitans endophyticus]
MPSRDTPPLTRAVVVRGVGFALAIALGAVAVWLIVTGSMNPRRIEIGVLAGLWGLLLGAYTMFGRRHLGDPVHYVTSSDVALRTGGGLEPAAQADARRAFEERLEHLLRTEISSSVNREVGDLRREVASLRQELVEKVGGELRLERIETTRLIGSDLEALQHEVRALKSARDLSGVNGARSVDAPPIPVAAERVDPPARSTPDPAAAARAIEAQAAAERQRAEAARAEQAARDRAAYEKASRERAAREQAERQKAEQAAREKAAREQAAREKAERQKAEQERVHREQLERQRVAAEQAAREKAAAEQAERQRVAAEQAAREKAAAEQAARNGAATSLPGPTTGGSADPFASLPRITPFTDFELDPVETASDAESAGDESSYTGRRRANGADADDTGRHSRHTTTNGHDTAEPSGRRRRDDHDQDGLDLLSQLLSRGSADR